MLIVNFFDPPAQWAAVEQRCAELDAERTLWWHSTDAQWARAVHAAGVPAHLVGGRIPVVDGGRAPPGAIALDRVIPDPY
jgi:hypothetical protein